MRTNRQTDGPTYMLELIFVFSYYAEMPKNFFKNPVCWYFYQYNTLEHGRSALHNLISLLSNCIYVYVLFCLSCFIDVTFNMA
jgi:hypothetical protein